MQSLKLKYNRETWQFYNFFWKDTGHFRPNNRTFWTFQNPDSQTWGSGENSNTKPNMAIKNSKNPFQKCPKNHNRTLFKHTLKHRHLRLWTKSPSVLIFWTPNGLFPTFEMIFFGNYQPPKLKHHARLRRIITSPEQNHLSCTNTRSVGFSSHSIKKSLSGF